MQLDCVINLNICGLIEWKSTLITFLIIYFFKNVKSNI
jgi:hypothetical protein